MAQDLALRAVLTVQDLASGVMRGFGSVLSGTSGPMGLVSTGLLAIGGAIIGVGAMSAKMAGDYQQGMNKVQALTGASNVQMAQYNAGLKQLAMNAGVAPTALTDGLYNVLSASYTGATAMKVLTLATEDSKIGMTDAATTTNALTTVLKGFSIQASDITRVNGEMISTVTLGKMTMADYAGAVGKAASTSMQYHVSMENMNASIATMTSNAIPSAHQAVTDYNQALSVLYGNIGTVTKSLHKSGIAFDETKFNAMSYGDKIAYMNQALQIASDKHVKITGVTKQAAQAIQVISQHVGEFNNDLSKLSNRQQMAAATQNAWNITQSGFNQTLDRLKATLDVVMINIGDKLLPILTGLGNAVQPLISNFADWINSASGLDTAFQPVQVTLQDLQHYISTLDFKPLLQAFSGLGGAFSGLKSAFSYDTLNDVDDALKHLISGGMDALTAIIKTLTPIVGNLISFVQSLAGAVLHIGSAFFDWVTKGGALQIVLDTVRNVIGNIVPSATHLVGVVGTAISQFVQWGNKSGFFNGVLHGVGGTVQFVTGLVGGIIDKIADFIGWLNKGSGPANALKIALLAIGGAIAVMKIGNMISDIIALIPQMLAWLTATWSQVTAEASLAVTEILANLPIYLIIAGILLLIGIVVLLVTHWSQVVAFLRGVWAAVANFFVGIWNHIVAFFVSIWNNIVSFVKAHALLLLAVITGPIGAIVILIVTHWNQILAFLKKAWQWVVDTAKSLWKDVTTVFSNAWNGISSAINTLWNNIVSFFQGLPSKMVQFGQNMITGLINGIKGMAGNLASAVTGLLKNIPGVGAVAGFLHIPGFAQGVTNFSGGIALVGENGPELVQLPSGSNVIPLGNGNDAVTMAPGSATPTSGPGAGTSGNTYVSVVVYAQNASAREVAKLVMQELNNNYKRSGSHVVVTSGGRANG